jgi:hypothetical protein
MRSYGWRYPGTASLNLTSVAPLRSRALKCNQFSVRIGTITHSRPTSGKVCSGQFRSNPRST